MKLKFEFNLSGFEELSETADSTIIGGFSTSHIAPPLDSLEQSNNCMGGNCAFGCGSGGQNFQCNTVSGCGQQ